MKARKDWRMRKYKKETRLHEPVLKNEVIEILGLEKFAHLKKQCRFIDATLGLGGHTREIIKKGGEVLGIEADPEMLKIAKERLERALGATCPSEPEACPARYQTVPGFYPSQTQGSFKLVHGNFRKIDEIARQEGFENVEGIIFDLGVSSPQLTSEDRGFSFRNPSACLDMRLDKISQALTAADLIASLSEKQLIELFRIVLDIYLARKISKQVTIMRKHARIETVGDFLGVISCVLPREGRLHPATKAFLALRIAVNSELTNLKEALPMTFELLVSGGRLLVISFHSKEDVIVKDFYKTMEKKSRGHIITKKPIRPSSEEIIKNPRARSAKMRVLEKL